MADYCLEHGIPIMGVFAVLSGLGILVSAQLPETLNLPPPEEVKELRGLTEGEENVKEEKLTKKISIKERRCSESGSQMVNFEIVV
jgi:hypothetical protein